MLVRSVITGLALVLLSPNLLAQDTGIESNLPGAGFGQSPTQAADADSSAPTIHVYSRETVVDITVTDSTGKPVRGLKQSDFTVLEDKQPQAIRSFHEFGDVPASSAKPLPALPPNVYTNLQPASGPLNVFLFDDINGGGARRGAEAFIRKMKPGTRVALLGIGDHFTVLHGPTTDAASLLKVIEAPIEPLIVRGKPCTVKVVKAWTTLNQMRELATYLSGIAGRKNVVWIWNGITDLIPIGADRGCQDWTLPLQQTYDLLEDAEATIYPVDSTGVHALGATQLTMEAVADATGGSAYYERNDIDYLVSEAVDAGSSYYTLSYVPRTTAYDGRYHSITVNVDHPNLHLVYRKGYSTEDPARLTHPPETLFGFVTKDPLAHPAAGNAATDPLVAAMGNVAPPATKLLFEVRVQPDNTPHGPADPAVFGELDPKLRKSSLTRYGLLYMLPQSQISFTDAGNGSYTGALEFEITAFDPEGRLVTVRSQTLKLSLTNDEYRQFIQTPFQFFQQIDLPPGQFRLRAGIRDTVSNKLGSIEVPLLIARTTISSK